MATIGSYVGGHYKNAPIKTVNTRRARKFEEIVLAIL